MTERSFVSVPLPLRLSGSALKVIAVISMVVDHWAFFFVDSASPLYSAMRCFGRIAFPVFAFLVAEGADYTRNRWRYLGLLIFFGMVSEIPWIMLNGNDGTHNVMFTLALGVMAISVFDRLCEHGPLCFLSVIVFCGVAWLLQSDYDWRGVLMIVMFYMLRSRTIKPWKDRFRIDFPKQAFLQLIFTFPLMMHYGIAGAMLASVVIFLYDGTRGNIKGAVAKYSFYAFYPAHLLLFTMLC